MDTLTTLLRTGIIAFIALVLASLGRSPAIRKDWGWRLAFAGFILVLFGSLLDLGQDFESLQSLPVYTDTTLKDMLEEVLGYFVGMLCILFAFLRIAPELWKFWEQRDKVLAERHRLNAMVHDNPSVILRLSEDGRGILINPAGQSLTGYAQAEFVNMDCWHQLFPQKSPSALATLFGELASGGNGAHELSLTCKDGSSRDMLWKINRSEASDGQVEYTAFGTDITALKTSEQTLRESEFFARKIAGSSLTGIYIYDLASSAIIYINPRFTALTGYTWEDLKQMSGNSFTQLIHPDDLDMVRTHMDRLLTSENGTDNEMEYRFRHRNGKWIWCRSTNSPFEHDEDGSVTQLIGTFMDITSHMRTTEDMIRLRRQESTIADLALGMLTETDIQTISRQVLEAAMDITGCGHGFTCIVEAQHCGLACQAAVGGLWELFQPHEDPMGPGTLGWRPDTRHCILRNDPVSDHGEWEPPAGTVPMDNFLAVPAMIGERLAGQIVLANAPEGFDEQDMAAIMHLGTLFAHAIRHMECEHELSLATQTHARQ